MFRRTYGSKRGQSFPTEPLATKHHDKTKADGNQRAKKRPQKPGPS
jgi:hypothetical protein